MLGIMRWDWLPSVFSQPHAIPLEQSDYSNKDCHCTLILLLEETHIAVIGLLVVIEAVSEVLLLGIAGKGECGILAIEALNEK